MDCAYQSGCSYPESNHGSGAKWIKDLTRQRLNNFQGGHFSDVNLSSILFTHRLDGTSFVELKVQVSFSQYIPFPAEYQLHVDGVPQGSPSLLSRRP